MGTETFIHPSAVVEPGAEIGAGVRIGPFCHVGSKARLGDGVELVGHVSVLGVTTIGEGTRIRPFSALGGLPQDLKHKGGETTLTVGANCDIRESVTMSTGSDGGSGATVVGERCVLFAYAHVAHDCIVGNDVTLVNNATLGGHCEIGDGVIVGGLTAVHQFVRVGRRAFLGGCSAVVGDVIPYGMAVGNRAKLRGFNVIGLKRSGMSRSELGTMREAYRLLFSHERTVAENAEIARTRYAGSPAVMEIVDFLTSRGRRHFAVPPPDGGYAADDDTRG